MRVDLTIVQSAFHVTQIEHSLSDAWIMLGSWIKSSLRVSILCKVQSCCCCGMESLLRASCTMLNEVVTAACSDTVWLRCIIYVVEAIFSKLFQTKNVVGKSYRLISLFDIRLSVFQTQQFPRLISNWMKLKHVFRQRSKCAERATSFQRSFGPRTASNSHLRGESVTIDKRALTDRRRFVGVAEQHFGSGKGQRPAWRVQRKTGHVGSSESEVANLDDVRIDEMYDVVRLQVSMHDVQLVAVGHGLRKAHQPSAL
jgi:hypothetical protein